MANPTATCETSLGSFEVELFVDKMPITANNWLKLAESGFYDGHRRSRWRRRCSRA